MNMTLPAEIDETMAHWASLWDISSLASQVTMEFSSRMTRSLGRCYPERRLIRLSERLAKAPQSILLEALCHELAHIAVHELDGGKTGPHGPAWAELMRAAGFEPRTRLRYPCTEAPIVRGKSAAPPLRPSLPGLPDGADRTPRCKTVAVPRLH